MEALKNSMDFLNEYTIRHFYEEEQLQKKSKFPYYPQHRQVHEAFKATIRELSSQLVLNGPSEALINNVREKVGEWLINHIQKMDKVLADYIKKQG
jgi:hemerythrin